MVKIGKHVAIVLFCLTLTAGWALAARKPLRKPEVTRIEVRQKTMEDRLIGVNPRTGESFYEPDYQGRIDFERATWNYVVSWQEGDERVRVVFEPQTKVEVTVATEVSSIAQSNRLKYQYRVLNGEKSKQSLRKLAVEHLSPVSNAGRSVPKAPKHWLRAGEYWWSAPLFHYETVRIPDKPRAWQWFADYGHGITPGDSLSIVSFESVSLPGIVNCYGQGQRKIRLTFPSELPEELSEALYPLEYFYGNSVSGKTVGPVGFPEPFEPVAFTEYIVNLTEESRSLGWIEDRGVADGFKGRLTAVGEGVARGETAQAKDLLKGLLTEVESEKGKSLLSEAYALLRFNIQYLLDNLK